MKVLTTVALAVSTLGMGAEPLTAKQNNTYTFELTWGRGNDTCLAGEGRAQPSGTPALIYGTCWDTTAWRT